jgi:hypothetical protein
MLHKLKKKTALKNQEADGRVKLKRTEINSFKVRAAYRWSKVSSKGGLL